MKKTLFILIDKTSYNANKGNIQQQTKNWYLFIYYNTELRKVLIYVRYIRNDWGRQCRRTVHVNKEIGNVLCHLIMIE